MKNKSFESNSYWSYQGASSGKYSSLVSNISFDELKELIKNPSNSDKIINRKMKVDQRFEEYKKQLVVATNYLRDKNKLTDKEKEDKKFTNLSFDTKVKISYDEEEDPWEDIEDDQVEVQIEEAEKQIAAMEQQAQMMRQQAEHQMFNAEEIGNLEQVGNQMIEQAIAR